MRQSLTKSLDLKRSGTKLRVHWKCMDCCMPLCTTCGERPKEPTNYEARRAGEGYRCTSCLYPPCPGCGKKRQTKPEHDVDNKPTWTCDACLKAKTYTCRTCEEQLPSTSFSLIRADSTERHSRCNACLWPPCIGCGKNRPERKSRNNIDALPVFVCINCRAAGLKAPPGTPVATPSAAVPPKVKGGLKRPAEPAVQAAPVLSKAVTVRKRPAAAALPQ